MTFDSLDFAALALFAAGIAVLAAGVVLLSGFLPLAERGARQRGPLADLLLLLASAAVLLLALGALRFAFGRLGLAPAVIAGGLALLAGPLLFQLLPPGLRNGRAGLLLVLLAGGALAAALNQVL